MNEHLKSQIGPTGLVMCQRPGERGPREFDPAKLRRDFPILEQTIHGNKKLAYLDNAATTQKPADVVCALCDYYQLCNANVHRSIHYLAEQATQRFEEARGKVARFIGASSTRSIIFTRGTTEGINLVANGWGRKFLKSGDEIIVTEMEHHSNLVPWQLVAKSAGAKLRFVPVSDDGTLDLNVFHKLLSKRTKLVAFTHVSNVLGTVNPAKQMVAGAHAAGALALVDGAQSVPHRATDVQDIGADFLAFSGHKMCGPTGIGVLYGREELLADMDPFMGGGEMISKVTYETATWAELPQKFEAGTPNIAGAVGLGAAVDYLQALGMDKIEAYEQELTLYAMRRLLEIQGLRIFGRAPERGGAISFEVDGIHPHDLAQFVDREGIAIRAGHMCCQPLMGKLDVPAVSRASVYLYNLREEIDRLVESIEKAKGYFLRGTR
jgi:cysteine desulfurase / selenocysteine lyase